MKFKYNSGDELYYTNPFIFTIDLVHIDFTFEDHTGSYYIDQTGAYLCEWDLHKTLEEAKADALNKLEKFHSKKINEILNCKPIIDNGEYYESQD